MQLADTRGKNISSSSSFSSSITSSSSTLQNFLSEAVASTSFDSFRPSSLPNALLKPDNEPLTASSLHGLREPGLTETFHLNTSTRVEDLQKTLCADHLGHQIIPSKKSQSLCTGKPFLLAENSSSDVQALTPPIGFFPRLSDPYLTYLLSLSGDPNLNNQVQRQSSKSATYSKGELLPSLHAESLLKSSTSHRSYFDYKLPFFSPPLNTHSVTQGGSSTFSSKSDNYFECTTSNGFPSYSSSSFAAYNKLEDSRSFPKILIIDDEPNFPSTSTAPASPIVHSGLTLNGRSNSLEVRQTGRLNCTPLKRSGSHSDIQHRRTHKMTNNSNSSYSGGSSIKKAITCDSDNDCNYIAEYNGRVPADIKQSEMYQTFQNWAIKNYGDIGKTKTVTRNKYRRIVRILTGEEQFTTENSKFRFWVKAKGFRLSSEEERLENGVKIRDKCLLVPSKQGSEGQGEGSKSLKRVAVVENFFDIIYNVHVEMDGRGGKHAGQKRTYRAIAEIYSFLPREAVTRFLVSCVECQKRMHLTLESNNNSSSAEDRNDITQDNAVTSDPPPVIDYNIPITQAYLNHMKQTGKAFPYDISDHDEESVSSDSIMSREASPSPRESAESKEVTESPAVQNSNNVNIGSAFEEAQDMTSARRSSPQPMETESRTPDSPVEEVVAVKNPPVPGKITESKGHPERKRRASSESGDSAMTKASEGKDEDDDDDNDDDEKIPVGQDIDPERLKAFNMFVRLFVDENLDRMVPISKQPKDKIQAILEACDRQFPEFHERSRKRIRTYLKSCRRMRRSKEHNGWEPLRPTPPHLTSAAAESLLATACENESQNAKRMRLGLEPLPASAMVPAASIVASQTPPITQPSSQQQPQAAVTQTPSQPSSLSSPRSLNCSVPTATDFLRHQPPPPTFRPAPEFTPSFFTNGHGAALFRPGFPSYQHPAHHHPSVLPHTPITANTTTNGEFGPTDLSMKKSNNKGQLSPSEVTAIKQLIAGYRESAAFLYRSADELEQLLLQQN